MSILEIEISGAADDYRVTARSAAGETRAVPVRFPFDELALERQLQGLQLALLRSSATVRRLTTVEERPVQEFGRRLFEFIFPPDVQAHLAASRQQAAQQEGPLRVQLRVGPPELAALPWEFLYDPTRDDYLCLTTPLVRYLDVLEPRRPLTVKPPLRILAMVAHPDELEALDVEHERRRLTEALADLEGSGRVHLGWVRGQTWWHLQKEFDQGEWHVFHFIGHGSLDSVTGEGVVAFAGDDGGVHRVGASDLALLLAEEQSLRLVVLNSCDTARATATDRFSSTASTIMRRGIPAIVAMQYEISDPAAISFARGFYDAIAAQQPVDQAVTRARRAIRISRRSTLEWATPVLYLRSPTGMLFDLTEVSDSLARHPAADPTISIASVDAASTQLPPENADRDADPTLIRPQLSSAFEVRQQGDTFPPSRHSPAVPEHARSSHEYHEPTDHAGSPSGSKEQSGSGSSPITGSRTSTARTIAQILWVALLWVSVILFGAMFLTAILMIATGNYNPLSGSIS